MAISLQELRKAEQQQKTEQQKRNQAQSTARHDWQEQHPVGEGVLKFARYLYER